MNYLKRPFFIDKLEVKNNIFFSPLAGCSDFPFRKIAKEFSPGLTFTEMLKMDALIHMKSESFRMLAYDKSMHPIGAQICGSKPNLAGKCAQMIEELGFDVIDLNCGCPVDKVTKDGSGSGLLKNPELIGEILVNMVSTVSIPVTVKIRAGWDDDDICAAKITKIAELAGAKIIFIHGRTRQQGYKGVGNRSHIKDAKDVARDILVFGNGDIFDPLSALDMFEQAQCDGILLSRGTMGSPWLVQDIIEFFDSQIQPEASLERSIEYLIKHMELIFQFQTPKKAFLDVRRVGCWYAKSHPKMAPLRAEISQIKTQDDVDRVLATMRSMV